MAKEVKNLEHSRGDIPEELEEVKAWWAANGNIVVTVLCVVLAVVLGVRYFKNSRMEAHQIAQSALWAAATANSIEEIIRDDKSSEVTALARLRLGAMYLAGEKYDVAETVFLDFIGASPSHPMRDIAEISIAYCKEGMGDAAGAMEAFKAFEEKYSDSQSFLVPEAVLGKARCMILSGDKNGARTVLDHFITENPRTEWAGYAEQLLKSINRLKMPESESSALILDNFFSESGDAGTAVMDEETTSSGGEAETSEKEDTGTGTQTGGTSVTGEAE